MRKRRPSGIADHDLVADPARRVRGTGQAAELRARAEQGEIRRAHHRAQDALRVIDAGERRVHGPDPRHLLEYARAQGQVVELRHGEPRVVQPEAGQLAPYRDQPLGIREGEGPEQDGVHHAEDGGVRADAQGQREDGGGGEERGLRERAASEADVLQQAVHRHRHLRILLARGNAGARPGCRRLSASNEGGSPEQRRRRA
jgi:hypothetical protein